MCSIQFPRNIKEFISGIIPGLFIGLIPYIFTHPSEVYKYIDESSDETISSNLKLLVKLLFYWSLYFEGTPILWRFLLKKTQFWHRFTGKYTNEGLLVHHEIQDGLMVSVQHWVSTASVFYALISDNHAFFRFGALSEIAYELNDTFLILFNIGRNKGKPLLIKILLLLHHMFGLTVVAPFTLFYMNEPVVKTFFPALMFSGATLCSVLSLQYVPNIETKKGTICAILLHAFHLIEFVWLRWYIGFGDNEWIRLFDLVKHNNLFYRFSLFGGGSLIAFNTIITAIFTQRLFKVIFRLIKIERRPYSKIK